VYGELLGAAQRLVDQLGELDPVTRRFLTAAADTAASRWKEKDQGIWEVRGEPRDFLYSKLMCWVALNRAIALAAQLGAQHKVPDWTAARDQIRAAILEHGWSEKAGAFTQAFGGEDLDASNLMLACTGFLPGDDPRMKATIDATAARLTDKRGLVYRYLAYDGLAGEEGTFLLCTFWLAHAQALAGEVDAAKATFERAVAAINDVGLLAEEVDAGSGEMIGNFPQAFSHIGLINAAWAIAQAEQRTASAVSVGAGEAQGSGSLLVAASRYRIVLRGRLSERFESAFEGMTLEPGPNQTVLTGDVRDQAHLYGLLDRLRDFGIELLAVEQAGTSDGSREPGPPR
jgi:GH15 family glucan-1,4-alpha-glucosidase